MLGIAQSAIQLSSDSYIIVLLLYSQYDIKLGT